MLSSMRRSRYDDDIALPSKKPTYAIVWILLFSGLGVIGLFACCGCGIGAFFLLRDDITGTTWRGTENLPGFGPLTFEFHKNGDATMRDARGVVNGKWTRAGSRVTIRFANCEYRGTINGNQMSGTAHGAAMLMGQVWTFSVTRD